MAPVTDPHPTPRFNLALEASPLEPWSLLAAWEQQLAAGPAGLPAAHCHFIGRVRGHNSGGTPLEALELEHYPGMTERQLQDLVQAIGDRHRVVGVLLRHRIGRVGLGQVIVLVAVAADRRGPAQRCCQELLEAVKHEVPLWKREWLADGRGLWVTGNTPL